MFETDSFEDKIQKREDEVSVLVKIIEKHKLAVQKKIPLGEINQNVVEAKQEDVEKLQAKKKLAFEKFRQHHSKNQVRYLIFKNFPFDMRRLEKTRAFCERNSLWLAKWERVQMPLGRG